MSLRGTLYITASDLVDVDFLSKSDPFFQLTSPNGNTWFSEVVHDSLHHQWTTPIVICPLQPDKFTITVRDHDSGKYLTSKNTFLGSATFESAILMSVRSIELKLEGVPKGSVTIKFKPIGFEHSEPQKALLAVSGENVPEKSSCLQILSTDAICVQRQIGCSPPAHGKNPTYTPLLLCMHELCKKNQMDHPMTLRIYESEGDMDKAKIIGEAYTSPGAIANASKENPVRLTCYNKKGKEIKTALIVESFDTSYNYPLNDFINSGFEVNFAVCVDFAVPISISDPEPRPVRFVPEGTQPEVKPEVTPPVDKAWSRLVDKALKESDSSAHCVNTKLISDEEQAEAAWKDNLYLRAFDGLTDFVRKFGWAPDEVPINAFQTFNSENIAQLSGDASVTQVVGIQQLKQSYKNALVNQKSNMKSKYNHFSSILPEIIAAEFPPPDYPQYKDPLPVLDLKYPEEENIYPLFTRKPRSLGPLEAPKGKAPKFTVLFYYTERADAFGHKFSEHNNFAPHFVHLDYGTVPLLVVVVNIYHKSWVTNQALKDVKRTGSNFFLNNFDDTIDFDCWSELDDLINVQVLDYLASFQVTPAQIKALNLPPRK